MRDGGGVNEGLSTRAPFEMRGCHPHPARCASAPLQGRVKERASITTRLSHPRAATLVWRATSTASTMSVRGTEVAQSRSEPKSESDSERTLAAVVVISNNSSSSGWMIVALRRPSNAQVTRSSSAPAVSKTLYACSKPRFKSGH
jgi:hypothetical protein